MRPASEWWVSQPATHESFADRFAAYRFIADRLIANRFLADRLFADRFFALGDHMSCYLQPTEYQTYGLPSAVTDDPDHCCVVAHRQPLPPAEPQSHAVHRADAHRGRFADRTAEPSAAGRRRTCHLCPSFRSRRATRNRGAGRCPLRSWKKRSGRSLCPARGPRSIPPQSILSRIPASSSSRSIFSACLTTRSRSFTPRDSRRCQAPSRSPARRS